jgi:hypothetical protein
MSKVIFTIKTILEKAHTKMNIASRFTLKNGMADN